MTVLMSAKPVVNKDGVNKELPRISVNTDSGEEVSSRTYFVLLRAYELLKLLIPKYPRDGQVFFTEEEVTLIDNKGFVIVEGNLDRVKKYVRELK